MFKDNKIYFFLILSFVALNGYAQKKEENLAKEIVEKSYYNQRSNSFTMDISMEVIRPKWTRELVFTTWSLGRDLGMMKIESPAKEKGISFLRINTEGWNWIPSISRVVKISPSQMSQSWMGSDFTNEDLLKEASVVHDYNHRLIGTETYNGRACYKIEALPKTGAAVVWGKLLIWVDKEDMLQVQTEYYSESGTLVNSLTQSDTKQVGGKKIATRLTMTPSNKTGNKTIVTVKDANFQANLTKYFFSVTNMKNL